MLQTRSAPAVLAFSLYGRTPCTLLRGGAERGRHRGPVTPPSAKKQRRDLVPKAQGPAFCVQRGSPAERFKVVHGKALVHKAVGELPGLGVVDHAPEHVLGVGAEVGTVAVVAGDQVPGQVGDGHDAAVLRRVGGGGMGVLLGGDPGRPGAAVEQGVPAVVAGVVGLGAFLPAGGHGAADRGVFFFDVVDQRRIQIIAAGGFGVEAEPLVEFLEHIGDDGLLILHREHPDAEILGLVLFPEFLAGQPQQREGDLVAVLFVVLLGQGHRLVVEEAGVGHLDGGFQPMFVGDGLLGLEDVQAFGEQGLAADILLLALPVTFSAYSGTISGRWIRFKMNFGSVRALLSLWWFRRTGLRATPAHKSAGGHRSDPTPTGTAGRFRPFSYLE